MTNAQAALEAASRIHQKVTYGGGNPYTGVDKATDSMVLSTADRFMDWLEKNTHP